ncbi:fungal specific transcription factor domain-containing protein [Pochonia chlamydosporia 170]|uniref:Fungal specific transcription factor domain-containing protein n=1 Tax=Pochonia chlamydosporia 170 TaxID=1380566 RepID=A0A179F0W0_METCM|nr:fungal specific transcription factor domain-containing protein [Pochonia chlamydosporia 170]OAQ59105.2 fungal specific transcription factor domain-containing protein [Pochonia chlamydosporia 170]
MRCETAKIDCEGYEVRLQWESARTSKTSGNATDKTQIADDADYINGRQTFSETQQLQPPQSWLQNSFILHDSRYQRRRDSTRSGATSASAVISRTRIRNSPKLFSPTRHKSCAVASPNPSLSPPLTSILDAAPSSSPQNPGLEALATNEWPCFPATIPEAGSEHFDKLRDSVSNVDDRSRPQTQSVSGACGQLSPAANTQRDSHIDISQPSSGRFSAVYTPSALSSTQEEACRWSESRSEAETRSIWRSLPKYMDILPDMPLQRYILEYWTTHLCDIVLPVPGIYNPLREVFMPIALEGARSAPNGSNAAIAVFHLICMASAFQLSQVKDSHSEKDRFESLALAHHNLGLSHLRRNLITDQQDQYIPVLAALTLCIVSDTITVSNSEWRVHIHGAVNWLRGIDATFWSRSRSASVVYQMFAGLAILSLSPGIIHGDSDSARSVLEFQCPRELYCLDRVYGVPHGGLEAINAMDKMQGNVLADGSIRRPDDPTSDLDAVEMEMYLSVPDLSVYEDAHGADHMLIYHLNYAFYYANMIYFKRTIRKAPVKDVQPLVEKSLRHLEAAISCSSRSFSPLVWTACIGAFEMADQALQRRFISLIDKIWRT